MCNTMKIVTTFLCINFLAIYADAVNFRHNVVSETKDTFHPNMHFQKHEEPLHFIKKVVPVTTTREPLIHIKTHLIGKEQFKSCIARELSTFKKAAMVIVSNAKNDIDRNTKHEREEMKPLITEVIAALNGTSVGVKERIHDIIDDIKERDYFGAAIDAQQLHDTIREGFDHLKILCKKIKHVRQEIRNKIRPIIKLALYKLKEQLDNTLQKVIVCKHDLLLQVTI